MRRDGEKRGAARNKVKPPPKRKPTPTPARRPTVVGAVAPFVPQALVGPPKLKPSEKSAAQVRRESDARARRQATTYGANQAAFVLDRFAKPPPKVPKPFVKPTAREAYKAEVDRERDRFNLARAAPVSLAAQRRLRQTEAPVERKMREGTLRGPPPKNLYERTREVGSGLVADVARGLGELGQATWRGDVGRAVGGAGLGALGAAADLPERVVNARWTLPGGSPAFGALGSYGATAERGGRVGQKVAEEALVGHELVKGLRGEDVSPWWFGADVGALATFPVSRPVKAATAVTRALLAAREGKPLVETYRAAMAAPALTTQAYRASVRSPIIKSAERDEAHAAIRATFPNESADEVDKMIRELDADIYDDARRGAKGLPARQEKAKDAYTRIAAQLSTEPEARNVLAGPRSVRELAPEPFEININRNASIEAELNPHYAPLPLDEIPHLDEAASAAHLAKSIEDAKRMPSVVKDPELLAGLFQNAYRLAVKGAAFRKWYEVSANRIFAHVHGDKDEANKLAQLFGIYSANRDVPANGILALRAYDEWLASKAAGGTGKITQGSADQIKVAEGVMSGTPWSGRKTNTFYSNLARHLLTPKEYKALMDEPIPGLTGDMPVGNRKVTVDVWMKRMFNFAGKVPTDAQYTWIENHIIELARQLGWSPEEVQAATWVALKAETEATSMERAAYDFAHAIETHAGQLNFEAITDELRRLLPPELRAPHLRDVLETIEPGGRNLIREIVGVPGTGGHLGPGIETVEGQVMHNPGAAHYIPLLRTVGPEGDYVISPAERQMAEEAAAAYGHVLHQRAVAYGRIFQAKTKGHANAIQLRIPGGLTDDLADEIARAVGPDVAVVHAREGAWLLSFHEPPAPLKAGATAAEKAAHKEALKTYYKSNTDWIKEMLAALKPLPTRLDGTAVTYDGALVQSDEYAALLDRLGRRRPESRPALDGLASDVAAVNQRYADAARRRTAGGAAERVEAGQLAYHTPPDLPERSPLDVAREGPPSPEAELAARATARAQAAVSELDFNFSRQPYLFNRLTGEFAVGQPNETHIELFRRNPLGVEDFRTLDQGSLNIVDDEINFLHPTSVQIPPATEAKMRAQVASEAAESAPAQSLRQRLLREETGTITPGAAPEEPAFMRRVRKAVRDSRGPRAEQKELYLEEAARKAKAADEAMRGLEGEEAILAARKALKGKFPQVEWDGLRDLDQAMFEQMADHIARHPDLKVWEVVRAHEALTKMVRGQSIQLNEDKLLSRIFKKETMASLREGQKDRRKLAHLGIQVYHLPRTMMSTLDLSFPLRQSIIPATRHPIIFARNVGKMHRQWASEEFFQKSAQDILERPTYPLMKGRVSFSELDEGWSAREEAIPSALGEGKIAKKLIVGHGIRASSRGYTGMANNMRADLFDVGVERLQRWLTARGETLESYKDVEAALDSIGILVNSATGRGGAKHENTLTALKALNFLLFSPRLLKSRLDFLNPFWYASLHPVARRMALEQAGSFFAMAAFVCAVAREAGASVNFTDPSDSDFLKIKFGDTRIDILGGFSQVGRAGAMIIYQNAIAAKNVRENDWKITYEQFDDPMNTLMRFFRSKLAPMPSLIVDTQLGEDYRGQPVDVWKAAYSRMIPILASDMIEMHQYGYPAQAFIPYPLAVYGVSVSTYEKKQANTDIFADWKKEQGGGEDGFAEWKSEQSGTDDGFAEWKKGR